MEAGLLGLFRVWCGRTDARPFAWSSWDCMLEIGDWIRVRTGKDIGAKFRGFYSDAESCRALFRRTGGLVAAMRREFGAAGLQETKEPIPGDIAMVSAPYTLERHGRKRQTHIPMGAIMMPSGKWRARTEGGHCIAAFPIIVAWTF